jgi:hypothetical protein
MRQLDVGYDQVRLELLRHRQRVAPVVERAHATQQLID